MKDDSRFEEENVSSSESDYNEQDEELKKEKLLRKGLLSKLSK